MTFHLIFLESFRVALLFICQGTRKAVICARTFRKLACSKSFLCKKLFCDSYQRVSFLTSWLFLCCLHFVASQQQLVHLSTSRLLCQQLFSRFFIFLSCLAELSLLPAASKNKIISSASLLDFSRRAPLASYQTFSVLSIPFLKNFHFLFHSSDCSSLLHFQLPSFRCSSFPLDCSCFSPTHRRRFPLVKRLWHLIKCFHICQHLFSTFFFFYYNIASRYLAIS